VSAAASSADDAAALVASLRLESGERWGEIAKDFQLQDARRILDPHSPTPYHFLTRGRGGSKTSDLAACAIAVMLVQADPYAQLFAVAADKDQAALLIDSIRGFADRNPAVGDAIEVLSFEVRVRGTGIRLRALAADAAGAYGLRPYFTIIDELAWWSDTRSSQQLLDAMLTAAGKTNGRLVILTTAGDPTHFAYTLLQHAYADPLWHVHEVPGPIPWLDPARVAEQERGRSRAVYERLILNKWTPAEDRLANRDDLEQCATLDGSQPPQVGRQYAIGLDIGITNDRSCLCVCHVEQPSGSAQPQSVVVLDDIQTWQGERGNPVQLAEVKETAYQKSRLYRNAQLIADPYQAVGILQDLRARGVRVEQFNMSAGSNGQLASVLYQLIRNRALALPADEALLDELARVRIRESLPGVLRLDHDPGRHDDRAIALALAATWLLEHPPKPGPRFRGLHSL
jgi:hypothetical protein